MHAVGIGAVCGGKLHSCMRASKRASGFHLGHIVRGVVRIGGAQTRIDAIRGKACGAVCVGGLACNRANGERMRRGARRDGVGGVGRLGF